MSRYFLFFGVLFSIILFGCKPKEVVSDTKEEVKGSSELISTQADSIAQKQPVKESVFIMLERTPYMESCPSYKIQLFNTGRVIYLGKSDVERTGKYTSTLTSAQMKQIEDALGEMNVDELQSAYNEHTLDTPACILYIKYKGKKKKILNKGGAPQALRDFEKLIDNLVLSSNLKPVTSTSK